MWRLFNDDSKKIKENCSSEETLKILHQTIKKVTEDVDSLRFNTAVSQLMILTNHLNSLITLDKNVLHTFLVLLNPFAPHISEEINEKLGYDTLSSSTWPKFDNSLIVEDTVTIAVQFNGKMRGTVLVSIDSKEEIIRKAVFSDDKLKTYFSNMKEIKTIYINNQLINFVLKAI